MATKEVKVVINGEEFVSAAAKKAEGGMDGFAGKVRTWSQGMADLKAAWSMVSGAVQRAWDVVKGSIADYDALTAAQRKLEGTSKLTGIALGDLRELADYGRVAFGLSKVMTNDFATEIAKLTTAAGATSKGKEALQSFLDIGAARGMTAAQSLQALQQSILGIDEGTDKLFGKNPSTLWDEYAASIGKAPSKLSDAEKQMALLSAALEGGGLVLGEYGRFLDSTAGKAQQFAQRNQEASAELGRSFGIIREAFYDIGGNAVPYLYDKFRQFVDEVSVLFIKAEAIMYGWKGAWAKVTGDNASFEEYKEKFRVTMNEATESMRRSKLSAAELGKENERLGGTLGAVVKDADKAGTMFGGLGAPSGPFSGATRMFGEAEKAVGAIGPRAAMTATEIDKYGKMTVRTAKDVKDAKKEEERAWNEMVTRVKNWIRILEETTDGYTRRVTALNDTFRKEFPKGTEEIKDQQAALDLMRKSGDDAFAAIKQIPLESPKMKHLEKATGEVSAQIVTGARAALDFGDAFGILDDDAKKALGSIINVAEALPKALAGDATSIAGVVGGLANLASMITGGAGAETRRLYKENNTQLARLRDEIGNLSLDMSGDDFQKATIALKDIVPKLGGDGWKDVGHNAGVLMMGLDKAGLSFAKLKEIADTLGIQITKQGGGVSATGLRQLLEALGLTEFGKFGDDFNSQKQATEAGFDVNGIDAKGQIGALADLGASFAPILQGIFDANDLAGTRSRLSGLFARLNSGGVSATEMGGLTGSQFLELITNIIGRIDALAPETAAPPPAGVVAGDPVNVTIPGVGTVSVAAAEAIPTAIAAQTDALRPILAESMTYHQRTADAVEMSSETLVEIRNLLAADGLRSAATLDMDLERARRAGAAYLGAAPAIG